MGIGIGEAAVPGVAATPPVATAGRARLGIGLFAATLALYAVFGSVTGVLLPSQVADIDPAGKVAGLGAIAAIGAVFATLANPLAGALSDVTRGRLGRRTPWLLAGAAGGCLALVALGRSTSLIWVAVWWCCAQVLLNCVAAPMIAVLADRTSPAQRGLFSSVVGIAVMLGLAGGTAAAAALSQRPGVGYVLFGGLLVLATVLFVVLNRDVLVGREAAAERLSLRRFLSGFAISPRRFPDFWWAFLARFALILGYSAVFGFQLYILRDYIGLSANAAAAAIPGLSAVSVLSMLVASSVCGPLSDRLDRRRPFVILATLVIGVALLLPIASPTLPTMFAQAVISGFGYGCYLAVDVSLITLILPRAKDSARDLGIMNIANSGPQTVGPFAAAAVIGAFGGYRALFGFAIVAMIVAALAIIPIRTVR